MLPSPATDPGQPHQRGVAALLHYFPTPNLLPPIATIRPPGPDPTTPRTSIRASPTSGSAPRTRSTSARISGQQHITPNLFQFIDTGAGRGINANLAWSRPSLRASSTTCSTTSAATASSLAVLRRTRECRGGARNRRHLAEPGELGAAQSELHQLRRPHRRQLLAQPQPDRLDWRQPHLGPRHAQLDLRRRLPPAAVQPARRHQRPRHLHLQRIATSPRERRGQSGTGYDLADFLLGPPATSSIRYGNPDKYFRGSGYDFYVNDDWRITPRFSLTRLALGLRHAGHGTVRPPGESGHRPATRLPWRCRPGRLNCHAPDSSGPQQFSPRLGFAWRPCTRARWWSAAATASTTTLGLQHDRDQHGAAAAVRAVAERIEFSGESAEHQNAFLSAPGDTLTSTYAIDPNYRVGYAQTWNLSVQNDLPFGLFATAGYLGTKGTRLTSSLFRTRWLRARQNRAPAQLHLRDLQRQFHLSRGAVPVEPALPQRLHGACLVSILEIDRQRRHRRTRSGQYTGGAELAGSFGRARALQLRCAAQSEPAVAVQHWHGTQRRNAVERLEGRAAEGLDDRRQYRNFAPGILHRDGGRQPLAGGRHRGEQYGAGQCDRPSCGGADCCSTRRHSPLPWPGRGATPGRNTIPGPTTFSLNGSMGRVFRFGERRSVDLQFQAQNLLNHVTITSWGTVLGSSNYGLATAAAAMRKITVNLRFRF